MHLTLETPFSNSSAADECPASVLFEKYVPGSSTLPGPHPELSGLNRYMSAWAMNSLYIEVAKGALTRVVVSEVCGHPIHRGKAADAHEVLALVCLERLKACTRPTNLSGIIMIASSATVSLDSCQHRVGS